MLAAKVSRDDLVGALSLAKPVADAKSTLEIMACALIEVRGKSLTVCATDQTVSFVEEVACEKGSPGRVAVPAKTVLDAVKNLPGEEPVELRGGLDGLEIVGGKSGKILYEIRGCDPKDYPKLPDHAKVEYVDVMSSELAALVSSVRYAASKDESRGHLCGVYIHEVGGKVRVVATDGHRLSFAASASLATGVGESGVLLPRKGVVDLERALSGEDAPVGFGVRKDHLFVRVRGGKSVVAMKLVAYQFPDYGGIIPSGEPVTVAEVEAGVLRDAVGRALVVADANDCVRVEVGADEVRLSAESKDVGVVRESAGLRSMRGPAALVAANGKFLAEYLRCLADSDVVFVEFGEKPATDPVVLRARGGEYVGLVMPLRVD